APWAGSCSRLWSPASPFLHLASLIPGQHAGHDAGYPREEPGAGKPHARICEGESRMAELLDHDRRRQPGKTIHVVLNKLSTESRFSAKASGRCCKRSALPGVTIDIRGRGAWPPPGTAVILMKQASPGQSKGSPKGVPLLLGRFLQRSELC